MFTWQVTFILLTIWSFNALAIDRSDLFPFGNEMEDTTLKASDDVSSGEIKLALPIAFYDQLYQRIYVSVSICFSSL